MFNKTPLECQEIYVGGVLYNNDTRIADFASESQTWYDVLYELKIVEGKGRFQLFYRNFHGKTLTLWVNDTDSVESIKEKCCHHRCAVIYYGRQLEDGRTIKDYKIRRESIIYLVGRLI